MTVLRMTAFQTRELLRNPFFIQTLIISILTSYLLQYFASSSNSANMVHEIATRAAMIGAWGISITATGLMGLQRYQGTFMHLLNSRYSPVTVLFTLLASASILGTLGLPMTYLIGFVQDRKSLSGLSWWVLVNWVLFILGVLVVSIFLAFLFVVTPYAIVYEGALGVPIIFLSGIFGSDLLKSFPLRFLSNLVPLRIPVQQLLSTEIISDNSHVKSTLSDLAILALWLVVISFLGHKSITVAMKRGTLELA